MPKHLSVSLLGGFDAKLDGCPLQDFQTEKARALFCFLIIENKQAHYREYLAGFLWPDQEEVRARHNLRQALSSLRKLLGENQKSEQPFLLVTQDTIQFNPDASYSLDVNEFMDLHNANQAHRHTAIACCLPCIRRLERMDQLYRGLFLSNAPVKDSDLFDEWVLLKKETLSRMMVEGLQVLADYHTARGEWKLAQGDLHKQLDVDPWREESHRMLMKLYVRDGQRSAAIAQFVRCSKMLERELGIEPTQETIGLFQDVQSGTFNAAQLFPLPQQNLPSLHSTFVGKKADLIHLSEMLANPDCRLITILGPGGVGKTRLAHQAASEHIGLFEDGVFFIALAAAENNLQAMNVIANALSIPVVNDLQVDQQIIAAIKHKKLLIILDNFEQLVKTEEFLSEVLRGAPYLKVIVTSRERLHINEEWVYQLEGMDFPHTTADSIKATDFDSITLFIERAKKIQNQFQIGDEDLRRIAYICQVVEGNPLGVEMAAAAVGEQSCSAIARSLKLNIKSLSSRFRNAPKRHGSLRAVFNHSWEMLSASQKVQLASLAVFQDGFSFEAAQYVSQSDRTTLSDLTSKSLVQSGAGDRYWMHETIRQFALEQLVQDASKAAEISLRHCSFYTGWILSYANHLSVTRSTGGTQMIQVELTNVITAWHWALDHDHLDKIETMLPAISHYYLLRGPLPDGEKLFHAAIHKLSTTSVGCDKLINQLKIELARLLGSQALYESAFEVIQEIDDMSEQGHEAVLIRGQLLQQRGEHAQARVLLNKVLDYARASANHRLEAEALRELGSIAVRESDDILAREFLEPALQLYQELNDHRGKTAVLNNLGVVDYAMGTYDSARNYLNQAMEGYRFLGDLRGVAKAATNLANLETDLRNYKESIGLYEQALKVHREISTPRGRSGVIMNLGMLYCELGDYQRARSFLQEALEIFQESNNQQAIGEVLANYALLEHFTGNQQAALSFAEQAILVSERSEDPGNLSNIFTYQGKTWLALGNLDAAELSFNRAIEIREKIPHPNRIAELKAEHAHICLLRGQTSQAMKELEEVIKVIGKSSRLEGCEDMYRVYWICHQVLSQQEPEMAAMFLHQGYQLIIEEAERIEDPHLKSCFLENKTSCKLILNAVSKSLPQRN